MMNNLKRNNNQMYRKNLHVKKNVNKINIIKELKTKSFN